MLKKLISEFNDSFDSINDSTSREDLISLLEKANTLANLFKLETTEMDEDYTMYVVVKSSRQYIGGPGYTGPACQSIGVEPGRIYSTYDEALVDAKKLSENNTVGFVVEEYLPPLSA